MCAHAVVTVLCIRYCMASRDGDTSSKDSALAVGVTSRAYGQVLQEQRSMKSIHYRNQSNAGCFSTVPQLKGYLSACASEAAQRPLSTGGSCQALAMTLTDGCEAECTELAQDLPGLSLIELTGPADHFFAYTSKPCLAYQVAMVSALKGKLQEFISGINGDGGELDTSCRQLEAVWKLGGILREFGTLTDQLKRRMKLPTNGDIPDFPSQCDSTEDASMKVRGGPAIDVDVADVFDSYFHCRDFNSIDGKNKLRLLLGEQITAFKCSDVPDLSRLSADYPGPAFYAGTTDITCVWKENGRGGRHDEGRGMKAVMSQRCKACPDHTKGLSKSGDECCIKKVNKKTGECCESTSLFGECR